MSGSIGENMRVLDLFSGLGGFSQAFVNHGWEVLRIDNNPLLSEVPHTYIIDIFEFRDSLKNALDKGEAILRPDVILASPPCYEFSNAFDAPRGIAARQNKLDSYEPDMQFLIVTLEIIELLCPKWWVIENVHGAVRYFKKYVGEHRQKIDCFYFWGNYPLINVIGKIPTKREKDKRHSELRSNHMALIPINVSQAFLIALLEQTYITDWL